ncbi:MAG: S26 family signal peptidase [Sulfurimonas sp.]|jgi:signal peptidase I
MKISLLSLKPLLKNKLLWGGLVWVAVFPFVYEVLPTRIDMTMDKSLPFTVWITEKQFNPTVHHYVMFKPTVQNEYTAKVGYFFKEISCQGGQELIITENKEYFCDGRFIGMARSTDQYGKPVENFVFNGVVPKDSLFMTGTHPRSYDSKYYGFVKINQIERGATPIW